MMIRIGTGRVRRSFSSTKKAAPLGHHHVEDHQVGVFPLGHRQALVAVPGDEDLEARRLQGDPHRFDDLAVVVDQQDAFPGLGGGFNHAFLV